MVHTAKEWPWSNYRATTGDSPVPRWLETDWILATFAQQERQAQSLYAEFVAEGNNKPSPWEQLKNQIYLGSDKFVMQMQRKVDAERTLSEIPKRQRRPVAHPLGAYFDENDDRDSVVTEAFRSGSYTMKAIADHLNLHHSTTPLLHYSTTPLLHYSTISRIVTKANCARDKT